MIHHVFHWRRYSYGPLYITFPSGCHNVCYTCKVTPDISGSPLTFDGLTKIFRVSWEVRCAWIVSMASALVDQTAHKLAGLSPIAATWLTDHWISFSGTLRYKHVVNMICIKCHSLRCTQFLSYYGYMVGHGTYQLHTLIPWISAACRSQSRIYRKQISTHISTQWKMSILTQLQF